MAQQQPQQPLGETAPEMPPLASEATPAPQDAETAALQPLVLRTCLALQAMASSLEALESVFARMEALDAGAEDHRQLLHGTEETVAHVIALLRREGPALLFRAQALRLRLRLHGYAAGHSAALALRTLHADLDGLAGFKPERPARILALWAPFIRRARSNTLIMLSEFDRHARQIAAQVGEEPAL
ncbi:hypothetical protein [Sediminicoccus sp. KRV36]|uniref:hypothetical protein n=1 Tax=Sediminicoccus sp. KRV36 TaxID=3133721 RepID=UPI00200E1D52|nr:hypothetical protein [Sediminicoccus rosea]UPY38131.1 hypothetical protein LHU95_05385 [Sediminicoccus rosea]